MFSQTVDGESQRTCGGVTPCKEDIGDLVTNKFTIYNRPNEGPSSAV